MTKSQVDRLGERLRKGSAEDEDLRSLDDHRRSFTESYLRVVSTIRGLAYEPTGRLAKSTQSIVEKLRRESVRLSQIQDIAGCRIVVDDIAAQDRAVGRLREAFEHVVVQDRRERPSHGYRAVHVMVEWSGKVVEVQIRTVWQHLWAQLSEKLSDSEDRTIKYGGGPEWVRALLSAASESVARAERLEADALPAGTAGVAEVRQLRETVAKLIQEMLRGDDRETSS